MNPKFIDEAERVLTKEIEALTEDVRKQREVVTTTPPDPYEPPITPIDVESLVKRKLGPDRYALWLMTKQRDTVNSDELRRRNEELDREVNLLAKQKMLKDESIFSGAIAGADPYILPLNDKLRMELLGANKLFLIGLDADGQVAGSLEIVEDTTPAEDFIRVVVPLSYMSPAPARQPWYKRAWAWTTKAVARGER